MKRSKNGKWIYEDDRFKYIAYLEKAEIVELKAYSLGFRKIEAMIQKFNAPEGKFITLTFPDYHFKKLTGSRKEDIMKILLLHFKNTPTKPSIAKKLIQYKEHLIENYPELLI